MTDTEMAAPWDWERLVTVVLLIVAVAGRHILWHALSNSWHGFCQLLLTWGINITGQPWHPSGQPWPPSVGR